MENQKRRFPVISGRKKIIFFILTSLILVAVLCAAAVNDHVKSSAQPYIISREDALIGKNLPDKADCIMVLGCQVDDSGQPRMMLRDRLDCGIDLYTIGAAPKLLMTGDHGRVTYDEVNAMKTYAIDCGISSSDVFMDHAGFSTYESMYRARDVFDADCIIIVTQEYHLYRSVYNARALGLEAYGVAAEPRQFYGQARMSAREFLARCKDFVYCIFQPLPTFLGEVIPISGNGDLTAG